MDAPDPLGPGKTDGAARARAVAPADLPAGAWRMPRTVRFSDCDPAGIVFTARFVEMLNDTLEAFFRQRLGLDYGHIIQTERVGLGYAKVDCDFFRPGLMGDDLVFTVVLDRIGGASATFILHAHRGNEPILSGRVVMVATSLDLHKAIPLPPHIRDAFVAYQDTCS